MVGAEPVVSQSFDNAAGHRSIQQRWCQALTYGEGRRGARHRRVCVYGDVTRLVIGCILDQPLKRWARALRDGRARGGLLRK